MRHRTLTPPVAAALTLFLAGAAAGQCDRWELAATSGPSQRQNHEMAYDGTSIMLFAGQAAGVTNDETWLWDGSSWRQSGASGPAARSVHKMAHDPGLDRVILFGGSSGGALDDTWAWDGGAETWTQLFPPRARPHASTTAWRTTPPGDTS